MTAPAPVSSSVLASQEALATNAALGEAKLVQGIVSTAMTTRPKTNKSKHAATHTTGTRTHSNTAKHT